MSEKVLWFANRLTRSKQEQVPKIEEEGNPRKYRIKQKIFLLVSLH